MILRWCTWSLLVLAFAGATACIPSCNIPRERARPAVPEQPPAEQAP